MRAKLAEQLKAMRLSDRTAAALDAATGPPIRAQMARQIQTADNRRTSRTPIAPIDAPR